MALSNMNLNFDMTGAPSSAEKLFYGTITGQEKGIILGERTTLAHQEVRAWISAQNGDYEAEINTDLSYHGHVYAYTLPANSAIFNMAVASVATITTAMLFILHGITSNIWMEIAGGITLLLTIAAGVWEIR